MSNYISKNFSKNRFFLVLTLVVVFAVGGTLVLNMLELSGEFSSYGEESLEESYQEGNSYDRVALEAIKDQLVKNGINSFVISIKEVEDKRILDIKYQTISERDVLKQEMALIAGTFIGIKKYNDWDISGLEATVEDMNENIEGTWHISEIWIEDYINENITDEDLVLKIIDSYQSI
jgi:hypothetical protein